MTGLSEEPSRSAHFAAWEARDRRKPLTVLDLRLPADVLGVARRGHRTGAARAAARDRRGRQPRGVRDRGRRDATRTRAADALLDLGVELAIVKQGPRGVLGKTRHER